MRKYGKKERLKAKSEAANIYFILNFLNSMLPRIYHRNYLRHFRHFIAELDGIFKHFASIGIDFSENLTGLVKYEPQSLHWCYQQVTVHSGISKTNGNKICHAHFPDDHTHDQAFVKHVLGDISSKMDISHATTILVPSDNCKSQCKLAKHFYHLQMLANEKEKQVLRVWSIAGHGKREFDHVGGVAKISIKELHQMIISSIKALR